MKEKHQVIALFVISSILSPLSFVLYVMLNVILHGSPYGGLLFTTSSIFSVNWGIFVLFTTATNSLWIMMQYCIIRLFRNIDMLLFLASKISSLGLLLGNMLNLLSMWVGDLRQYVSIPIFFLGLVIWCVADIINFIIVAVGGKCDLRHKVEEKNDANTLTLRLLPNLKLPALLLVIIFMSTNIELLVFAAFYLLDLLRKLTDIVESFY
jgi:hypothetical protein